MRRRDFITLLGGAAALPIAARAQQPSTPKVIGWLSGRNAATDDLVLRAFRQGLASEGHIEGRSAKIEFRWADSDYERLASLAIELLNAQASLIVTVGTGLRGTQAVRTASPTVPIVFVASEDPAVKAGIVPSFNQPGGNTTGVTTFYREVESKRLELVHILLPQAKKIAAFRNPADGFDAPEVLELEHAAAALGKEIEPISAGNDRELNAAFATLSKSRPDALYFLTSPFFFSRSAVILDKTAQLAIPAFYWRREFAVAGGLMSYGSKPEDNYRIAGEYAGRILNGARAGDLPIQQPTKLDLVINLKTARNLRIMIPPTLLALADEVIE
jgi:putative ABC transport system substrate-binding protein